jgi:hypothetical protein
MDAHKDLENTDCLKCHDAGKGVPASRCLQCHKEIRTQTQLHRGFHGLMVDTNCIACHHDHKGRDYDSTKLDEKTFDHSKTGFSLLGKHANIKCSECHLEKRSKSSVRPKDIRYFGKTSTCASCHRKDDVHYFKGQWAKKDCNTCHGVRAWKEDLHFDHLRDTGYALEGAHEDLACAKCHITNKQAKSSKYHWDHLKTSKCMTCHEDVHKTNLSPKFRSGDCAKCHNQEHWKIEKFDHSVTGYPIRGKHAEIACTKCHVQKNSPAKLDQKHFNWTGLTSRCVSCHKDYHLFGNIKMKAFGNLGNCLGCHNEASWNQTKNFDHNTHTRYVIDGKHTELKCNDCHIVGGKKADPNHRVAQYRWPLLTQKTCENCHKSPHVGQFSAAMLAKKCTECHITQGWLLDKNKKNFNHNETRFPLDGKHLKLKCNDCHLKDKKQVFKFTSVEQKFCIDCHANQHKDQFHEKFSGQSCASCHSTEQFDKLKTFDHNQTQFQLKDAHAKLTCIECHVPTSSHFDVKAKSIKHKYIFPDLATKSCVTCHADYHNGQLGSDCAKCHSEKTWKLNSFDHNTHTSYPLKDKHKDVKCSLCHRPIRNQFVDFAKAKHPVIRYKPIPTTCGECHRDPHKGNLGPRCNDCHSERGWHVTKDFHKNFTLHGVHYTLGCNECHKDNRRLSGLSDQCIICHQKDDVHSGSLPDCNECHRQTFWEHTNFRHSMTFFPLRGTHRTLECSVCHSNGIYRGTPSQCIDCHAADAQSATSPVHVMPNFQNCQMCHNQFHF